MMKAEMRKLGGTGTSANGINLPPKMTEKLGWSYGDYIGIAIDEEKKVLILKKVKFAI